MRHSGSPFQRSYGEFELNLLCKSKGWIDPCPFWDEDGKAYMVFAYAKSLEEIEPVMLENVPVNSLAREFVGESSYSY